MILMIVLLIIFIIIGVILLATHTESGFRFICVILIIVLLACSSALTLFFSDCHLKNQLIKANKLEYSCDKFGNKDLILLDYSLLETTKRIRKNK